MDEILDNLNIQSAAVDGNVGCDCCCIESQDINFDPCVDIQDFTLPKAGDPPIVIGCQGRLLKLRVKLCNVCWGRCINVGVLLCENFDGTNYIQGFRACKVKVPDKPAEARTNCTDITIDQICFVLTEPRSNVCPQTPCTPTGTTCVPDVTCPGVCNKRTVTAKVIAHYSSFPSFPFCIC